MKRNNVKPVIGLYAGLDEEFAYLLEMELISKFGRKDLDKGSLLNRSDGGEGVRGGITRSMSNIVKIKIGLANKGKVRSKEARENISKSAKGRIPHNKGIPLNQEAKDNLRQKNLGKIRPQSEKDKIRNTMTGQKHEKVECQTCGKLVGIRSVNRYHNNNCKSI